MAVLAIFGLGGSQRLKLPCLLLGTQMDNSLGVIDSSGILAVIHL